MSDDRENKEGIIYWVLIGILILAGGSSSSLAVLLTCALTLLYGALFAIRDRNFRIFVKSLISCSFGFLYIIIYLIN